MFLFKNVFARRLFMLLLLFVFIFQLVSVGFPRTVNAGAASTAVSGDPDQGLLNRNAGIANLSNGDYITATTYKYGIYSATPLVTTPVFTSAATAEFAENQSGTVYKAEATGTDDITYSITGGVDQDKFLINSSTGNMIFLGAPNYEQPSDADGNNVYEATITADDHNGSTDQHVSIAIIDINDVSLSTSDNEHIENNSLTKQVTAGRTAKFTFKTPESDSAYLHIYGVRENAGTYPGGLYAYSGDDNLPVTLIIEAQAGSTFDLSSFKFAAILESENAIQLNYISKGVAYNDSCPVIADGSSGYSICNTFDYPINDVSQIKITASDYVEFQDFEITDIKDVIKPTGTAGWHDLGSELTDGEQNSTNILGQDFEIFYAESAMSDTRSDGIGLYQWKDTELNISDYPDVFNGERATVMNTQFGGDYSGGDNTARMYLVLKSTDGSEFQFNGLNVFNYFGLDGNDTKLKIIGFKNELSTGSVTIQTVGAPTFLSKLTSSELTPSVFQDVDRVVITPSSDSQFSDPDNEYPGLQFYFNSFSVDDPVLTSPATSPTLAADSTDNDITHPIDIAFTDDATWRGAITAVKDGNTALQETDYSIVSGKISINAGVLSVGSHTIKVLATGYADANVTQNVNAIPVIGGTVGTTGTEKYGETLAVDLSAVAYTPSTSSDSPTYQWNRDS
ncbi:hemoblobin-interacting domain-containing protein, partial [Paenibacillus endophyticus]